MFEKIKQEISNFEGETRQSEQGDSLVYRAVLEPDIIKKMPAITSFFELPEFRHLCNYTGGHIRPPLLYIEKINSHAVKVEIKDPQKTLHSDTFHPNMKFWFFIHDVKEDDGPFMYIRGSHKLTWKRLKWEYKKSITVLDTGDEMSVDGSFRFNDDAVDYMELDKPVQFLASKNTLLFANTFGIHCRGEAKKGATRLTIWGMSRTNPFIPFPGVTSKGINRLQYKLLRNFRAQDEARAKKNGTIPTWQVVDKEDMPF